MELTPEEKQTIYEEEKIRTEAQEKIKQEAESRNVKTGCMGCLAVFVIIFIISLALAFFGPKKDSEPTVDLNTSVRFTGTQFIISNNDNFDWRNVEMKVNSGFLSKGFVLQAPRLQAKSVYSVGAMQFTKSDGTRLNPWQTKPKDFTILCDTPQGRGVYSGGWR